MPRWGLDINQVVGKHIVLKECRHQSVTASRIALAWRNSFHGNAVVIRIVRTVRQRVAAGFRALHSRDVHLESQILTGEIRGQCLPVVRREIVRANVLSLEHLAFQDKLAKSRPGEITMGLDFCHWVGKQFNPSFEHVSLGVMEPSLAHLLE